VPSNQLHALLILLLGVCAGSVPTVSKAESQTPQVQQRNPAKEAFLTLGVNGGPGKEAYFCILYPGRGYAVAEDGFDSLRLRIKPVAIRYLGQSFIPLYAIEGVSTRLNEREQLLEVSVPPELIDPQNLLTRQEYGLPALTASDWGARFNYDLILSDAQDINSGGLFELGLLSPHGSFSTDFAVRSGDIFSTLDGDLVRLRTTYRHDYIDQQTSLELGDTSNQLRNNIYRSTYNYGGFRYGTDSALQPAFMKYPVLEFTGLAQAPSTIDLYLNNRQYFSGNLESGPFNVTAPAAITGSGEARLVIRDIFGREQVVFLPFFFNSELLRKGYSQYGLETGFPRDNLGTEDFDYQDEPFIAGSWRYGLTNQTTIAGEAEVQETRQSLGAAVTTALPKIKSSFELATAFSQDDFTGSGAYGLFNWRYRPARQWNLHLNARGGTAEFRKIGIDGAVFPEIIDLRTGLSMPLIRKVRFDSTYTYLRRRPDNDISELLRFNLNSVYRNVFYSVTYSKNLREQDDYDLSMNLSWSFGGDNRASVSHKVHEPPQTTTGSLRRTARRQQIGYDLSATRIWNSQQSDSVSASLSGISDTGDYLMNVTANSKQNATISFATSGGIVATRSHVLPSRRVADSFAIVEIPNTPGVGISVSSDEILTNSDGLAVIPLHSLATNHINVDKNSLPIGLGLSESSRKITPVRNAATYLKFAIPLGLDATARLKNSGEIDFAPGTAVQINDNTEYQYVGAQGFVYLTELVNGENHLRVISNTEDCLVTFSVEPSADPLPDLGELICKVQQP